MATFPSFSEITVYTSKGKGSYTPINLRYNLMTDCLLFHFHFGDLNRFCVHTLVLLYYAMYIGDIVFTMITTKEIKQIQELCQKQSLLQNLGKWGEIRGIGTLTKLICLYLCMQVHIQ